MNYPMCDATGCNRAARCLRHAACGAVAGDDQAYIERLPVTVYDTVAGTVEVVTGADPDTDMPIVEMQPGEIEVPREVPQIGPNCTFYWYATPRQTALFGIGSVLS